MTDEGKDPIQLLVDTLAENQRQIARLLETTQALGQKVDHLSAAQAQVRQVIEEKKPFGLSKEGAEALLNGLLSVLKADHERLTLAAERTIREAGASSGSATRAALSEAVRESLGPVVSANIELRQALVEQQEERNNAGRRRLLIGLGVATAFLGGMAFDASFLRLDRQMWRVVHLSSVCKIMGGQYIDPKGEDWGGCWFSNTKL